MRTLGLVIATAALIACASAVRAPAMASAADLDCADFSSQAEAQEHLYPGDPYGLDGDGDGIACEDNPCPCSGSVGSSPSPTPTPSPTPAPPQPPPYRLSKAAARAAAKQLARRFVRRNPAVDSLSFGGCNRLGSTLVRCRLTARGSDTERRTTCSLTIVVGAENRQPQAGLASSPCRTVRTFERASATAIRGLAEWVHLGPSQTARNVSR